jgi:hypothetical protein
LIDFLKICPGIIIEKMKVAAKIGIWETISGMNNKICAAIIPIIPPTIIALYLIRIPTITIMLLMNSCSINSIG